MSKTRTGRKGRARLAVAGHLNATGGARTSMDNDSAADVLEKLLASAVGQGAAGELFSQGEVRGALQDADCSASGIFEADETAGGGTVLAANVSGESSLSLSGDLPQLQGEFSHHYMQKTGVSGDVNAAIAASRDASLLATTTSGIAYLPSGPGAKFIPSAHGLAQNDVLAFSISPDFDTVKASSYSKMSYVILGDVTGHTLAGRVTQHVQAFVKFDIDNFAEFNAGDEIRINGTSTDGTLVKLIASADASNGIDTGNGINHVIDGSTVYVLEGTTSNNATAGVVAAAIQAWGAANNNDVSASATDDEVTVTMQKYKGATGNNAGGGEAAATKPLTITAYKQQAIRGETVKLPLDVTQDPAQCWFTAANGADVNFIAFAGGTTTATPFKDNAGANVSLAINGGAGFMTEDDKFKTTELEVQLTVGATVTTARKGLAIAWSLS